MELHVVKVKGKEEVVLLDSDMRIVRPVIDYLRFQAQKGRAPNTIAANAQDLKCFWKFMEGKGYEYDQVTPLQLSEFIGYLRWETDNWSDDDRKSKRTGKTINRILSTVHMFYQYHSDMEGLSSPILSHECARSPGMFKDILYHTHCSGRAEKSIFKVKEYEKKVQLVSDDDMHLFLSRLDKKRDILLYKLLYMTGARIQEVLDLEMDSVPIPDSGQCVGIIHQIKSKGKYRDLYVPMELMEELDSFILEERSRIDTDSPYVFVSEQAGTAGRQLTYSAAYDKLRRTQKKTGQNFCFHDLRHSFCSKLAESGMDVSIIRIIMGHEHIATTQKYTHLTEQYIGESLSRYWDKSIFRRNGQHGF